MSDDEVVAALERAGMEVEQINASKQIDERVVVALVKKVVQHPGADRLHLCDIEVGDSQYRVVCGAPNVRKGLKVAFAQIGAVLPDGEKIQKAKLRGEVSEGMLCSERELELGNDHNGIMELSSDAVVGTPLCDIYPADTVIDLKTPANRFDVLSVVGLAREVAAMVDEVPALPSPPQLTPTNDGPEVTKGAQAGRYMLARVTVNQTAPSPDWMTARLSAGGMRPVNPVVDVTNYVMLEQAQPLHAFDAHKVKLPITVRAAAKGETLTTLDGADRTLSPDDLVIADATGPIALAGVMGGAATEVSADTTEVLLESAVFEAATVRKMAKRHGLRTEASARMERSLPVELPPVGLARAVELLSEAGGSLAAMTDQQNAAVVRKSIQLPLPRLIKLLGFDISPKEAAVALTRLGIEVGESSKKQIVVPERPWWRPDLALPEDLIEEIVRVVGYERVPSTIPSWRPQSVEFDRERSKRRLVREVMYGAGLFEVMTYSFVAPDQLTDLGLPVDEHLKLKNPLSVEQAYLRSSLMPSHLTVLARNRTYAKSYGFYEISKVFLRQAKGEQPREPERLAVTVRRPEGALASVKGMLDQLAQTLNVAVMVEPAADSRFAPGRSGVVKLDGRGIGWIGQVHPDQARRLKVDGESAYVEVDLAPLVAASRPRQFAGLRRFPTIQRDVAVVLPAAVTWREVHAAVTALGAEPVFVADYQGAGIPAGSKSLTLRLVVAHDDRTPTEAEAEALEGRVVKLLARKFAAEQR
jgi:phenylalanyl-tRNA synthetase beta chain